ncbi:hypothetical protein GCM10017600_44930 [Streptosporangium carneum]|uniref:Uncharacterized protein n=1 Tax=Streptosporangium carneum TaxID=47481 RepID=A0A9W6I2Z2_9ACTN|nr:hypothetical protein GCM10017600_44930 [Streptosporangium carneum]
MWIAGTVKANQPTHAIVSKTVSLGELHGPNVELLIELHEAVVQIEEGQSLHGNRARPALPPWLMRSVPMLIRVT